MASSGCRRDARRLIVCGLLALLPAARDAIAQDTRLPADALMLLRADVERAALSDVTLADGIIPRGATFALRRDPGGPVRVDFFVRARTGIESSLRALCARVGARAGEWVTAQVPLDRLREVAGLPGVRSVEIARRARLLTDSSMIDIGASSRRRRAFVDQFEGSTGRGVIIGLVDSGIDFTHRDFIEDDTGRSRVVWLWDQTASGSGPPGTTFSYGRECSREQLTTAGACAALDSYGHGTHVAGIAASDGSVRTHSGLIGSYPGVAPGAELVVVKSDLSFTSIIDAVAYIFDRAAQLGRPAVVNLSLGTQLGPHDGDEAASLALDALSGPGRIVVAAAGNEGDNRVTPLAAPLPAFHAEGSAAIGDSITMTFSIAGYTPKSGSGNDLVFVQAFYASSDRFSMTVTRPNGTSVTVGTDGAASGNDVNGAIVLYNGTVPGDSILGSSLESGSFAPASQARVAELYLGEWVSGGAAPSSGLWTITMRRVSGATAGEVDAYMAENSLPVQPTFVGGANNRRLVGPPGDARTVITVGAYSTRSSWLSVNGNRYTVPPGDSVATGDMLSFSSPGPTRDGRLKPEISAPGRVFSALSSIVSFPVPLVGPDSAHVILEGTSMSTPHVTGAVALLLSKRPTMTPQQVLTALTSSARQDAFTARSFTRGGGIPNNSWGWGKLSVGGAIDAVTPLAGRAFIYARPAGNSTTSSMRGTLLPLQAVRLSATDAESLSVSRLDARVTGNDRALRLAVVLDTNHNGLLDAGEPVLVRGAAFELHAQLDATLTIPFETLVIPRGGVVDVVLAAELSGAVPNASAFSGALLPDQSATVGMMSGASRSLSGTRLDAATITTTVLGASEQLAISQNPVRTAPLVINFSNRVDRVEVFDFSGRRVRVMTPAASDRSLRWDLRDDGGREVTNGTYMIVVRLGSGTVRRRLFIAR